ncbi:MAG: alcohol dehydrogenase [Thermoprotei archaeon]|nr:MAG: alcohol dehydrogenase [Thermoprotei archaeon]RLF01895.1 MAG: alcohol dehydrogenase [Thermoprotei archaeon]
MGAFLKAFVILDKHRAEVREIDAPKPRPNEVLVRVKACGICGTDLHIFEGDVPVKYPVIPGHEFSGEVVEVGSEVEDVREGERVAVNPNISCGKCYYCKRGVVHFCERRVAIGIELQGAFAEYVAVPETNVHRLSNALSFEEAAFAEPIACCLHGQDLLNVGLGDTVAIFGLGPIGLIHLQLVRARGASLVIGVEVLEKRLKLGLKMGADLVINPLERDIIKEIREATGGRGVDAVIEATGNPQVLQNALKAVDYGGKVLVFGVAPMNALISISPFEIYRKEISIIGSFINPHTTERAVKILEARRINVRDLITHEVRIEQVLEVFEKLRTKREDFVKVIVKP